MSQLDKIGHLKSVVESKHSWIKQNGIPMVCTSIQKSSRFENSLNKKCAAEP